MQHSVTHTNKIQSKGEESLPLRVERVEPLAAGEPAAPVAGKKRDSRRVSITPAGYISTTKPRCLCDMTGERAVPEAWERLSGGESQNTSKSSKC